MDDNNLYGTAEGLEERGRHATFASALGAAFDVLIKEENPFFDAVQSAWSKLFPNLPARPGRSDSGVIVIYVKSAPVLFMMRQHLPRIKAAMKTLAHAPKRLNVRLEIHS